MKVSIDQDDIAILNVYVPSNRATKYMKQNWKEKKTNAQWILHHHSANDQQNSCTFSVRNREFVLSARTENSTPPINRI